MLLGKILSVYNTECRERVFSQQCRKEILEALCSPYEFRVRIRSHILLFLSLCVYPFSRSQSQGEEEEETESRAERGRRLARAKTQERERENRIGYNSTPDPAVIDVSGLIRQTTSSSLYNNYTTRLCSRPCLRDRYFGATDKKALPTLYTPYLYIDCVYIVGAAILSLSRSARVFILYEKEEREGGEKERIQIRFGELKQYE